MHPDDKLQHLAGTLERVRWRTAESFTACCPSHTDKSPSLSVSEGERGLLIRCWAGCTLAEICSALGLKPADLFFDAPTRRRERAAVAPRPARLDWRRISSDLLHGAEGLELRAERILEAARGFDCATWKPTDADAALLAVAVAYRDEARAELYRDLAFNLRARAITCEREKLRRAA